MIGSAGTTPLCAHCGRPVLAMAAYGNAGEVYHFECTQSPYAGKLRKALTGEPLGAEFGKVWDDNVDKLYES